MRRLLALTVLVIFINAALISLSRSVGGASLDAYPEFFRTLECKLPCWIGINPGITKTNDAEERIAQVYAQSGKYDVSETPTGFQISSKHNNETFQVDFTFWQGEEPELRRFHEIVFSPCRGCTNIGNSLNLFGIPNRIFPASQTVENKFTYLIYDDAKLMIKIDKTSACDSISVYQPVVSFMISSDLPDDFEPGSTPWRGFGACYSSPHSK